MVGSWGANQQESDNAKDFDLKGRKINTKVKGQEGKAYETPE